jgi:hypothetical protein
VVVNRSELDHGKTGNQSKVADIQSCDSVAKMQRCGANQQIFEGDAYAESRPQVISQSRLRNSQPAFMRRLVPAS